MIFIIIIIIMITFYHHNVPIDQDSYQDRKWHWSKKQEEISMEVYCLSRSSPLDLFSFPPFFLLLKAMEIRRYLNNNSNNRNGHFGRLKDWSLVATLSI